MIFKKTEVYGYVNLGGEAILGSEVVSIIKSNSELKLIKNDRLIARATFVFDKGDTCAVQVFNDQFLIKTSEITKKL